jgi:hypothetical protein
MTQGRGAAATRTLIASFWNRVAIWAKLLQFAAEPLDKIAASRELWWDGALLAEVVSLMVV